MMIKNIFSYKLLKFLIGGGVAALFNLYLIFMMIEQLGWNDDPFLRNLANAIAIELSLIFSFFIYRTWVWSGGNWNIKDVLMIQIPLYHLSAGSAVVLRIFFVFPALDWIKVDYRLNTLIGVLLSAFLNYFISDRLVFKNQSNKSQDIFYPEGLEPSLHKKQYFKPRAEHQSIELLSLVIPAYNEEDGIESTIQNISQVLTRENIPYEILVVNDSSKDNTELVLQRICNSTLGVRYINNYYPNGFGFAVRCGLENFEGDAVAIVMADSSDSPEDIIHYYRKLEEGYECVFGSRFVKGGKVFDYPTHKLIVNRLANLFIKVLFGLKFNDTTNAFKAYRREVIEGISPLISHHFNLTVEIPLKSIARGYSYTVVPITWTNRKTGISKLRIREMGSRYLFIVLFILLEKFLSRGDYIRKHTKVKSPTKSNQNHAN